MKNNNNKKLWIQTLRYYGGTEVIDIIRGNPGDVNIPIPSLSTLKNYTPRLQYGMIAKETLEEEIKYFKSQGELNSFGIIWDAIIVRDGMNYIIIIK